MNIMHPVLRRLDLNLLPVFDAIYRHRSVRLAADELAMSTSALSHALSRLRITLNDPLFFREGHRMSPSVYASQLAPSIASALSFLNHELTPQPEFDAASSSECLQIAITDFTALCIFPALMHKLQLAAPGLRFELRYLPHSPALTELLAGEVDLALGFSTQDDIRHPELEEIDWFKRIMAAYPDAIAPVYTAADIRRNAAAGKISGMLTIEEGACCKGSVRRGQPAGVSSVTGWIRWLLPTRPVWPTSPPPGRTICTPVSVKGCTLSSPGALSCPAKWPARRRYSSSHGQTSTPSAKPSWRKLINTATPACCANAISTTAKR